MKVKSLGFRIIPVGAFSIPQLAGRLVEQSGSEFTFRGCDRQFYCSTLTYAAERYAVGLFLTIRDQRRFLQLQETNGKLKVTVTELDDDSRAFDFNFFVIHLESGSGLYSHYHHSCSLTAFHAYLRDQFLRALKEQETGEELEEDATVRRGKNKDLTLQLFYRRDTFEDAVKELQEVNQFEYDVLAPESMTKELQPIKSKLKLERREVRIKAGVTGNSFYQKIKSMIPKASSSSPRFRVVGKDSSGDKTPIDFVAPPDHFSEDEFDDLADDEILNLAEVDKSFYIRKLLKTFKDGKAFFTAEAED